MTVSNLLVPQTPISQVLITRLKTKGLQFYCNDNISTCIESEDELNLLQKEVEEKLEDVLRSLVIDVDNDHNTHETARRIAKMFIKETFVGRYAVPPVVTVFPNTKSYDEIIITKAKVRSCCAHHFQNIIGNAYVGTLAASDISGLSKIHRIVDHYARRPQTQEELTIQIADEIEHTLKPLGVGIVIKSDHFCVSCRGVNQDMSWMTTSVMRGLFKEEPSVKAEFLHLVEMSNNNL